MLLNLKLYKSLKWLILQQESKLVVNINQTIKTNIRRGSIENLIFDEEISVSI